MQRYTWNEYLHSYVHVCPTYLKRWEINSSSFNFQFKHYCTTADIVMTEKKAHCHLKMETQIPCNHAIKNHSISKCHDHHHIILL